MSATYKKQITATLAIDYIKCDICGVETPFSTAIDTWCKHEGKTYCLKCQREHQVGWHEPKKEATMSNWIDVKKQLPSPRPVYWPDANASK